MPLAHLVFILLSLFSSYALSADLTWECQGKTRFIHRGAESTYPVDEQRHYQIQIFSILKVLLSFIKTNSLQLKNQHIWNMNKPQWPTLQDRLNHQLKDE
jgi:hypothetical protein